MYFSVRVFASQSHHTFIFRAALSLEIPAGAAVAIVGESGSGKSTILALVERFYDVLGGSVTVDGVDVRELNMKWCVLCRSKFVSVY